jgi:hypothetical protein
VFFVCNLVYNMLQHITNVIKEYQAKFSQFPFLLKKYFKRYSLRCSDDPNKTFLTFLFCDNRIGVQFLKDAGLIRSKVECNCCGRDMTCYAEPSVPDGFRTRCQYSTSSLRSSRPRIGHAVTPLPRHPTATRDLLTLFLVHTGNMP